MPFTRRQSSRSAAGRGARASESMWHGMAGRGDRHASTGFAAFSQGGAGEIGSVGRSDRRLEALMMGDCAMKPATIYRTVEVDGLPIFYREAGAAEAPVLLLLHGL